MEPEREELLLGRILDRCDTAVDWDELAQLGRADDGLWRRLCLGLRDDALVRAAAAQVTAIADRVPLARPRMRRRVVPWLGWAAASLFAALWLLRPQAPPPPDVIGELPRLLVEAQPLPDGRHLRVTSMRRLLEQHVVDRAFAMAPDEVGTLQATPVELVSLATPSDF